MNLRSRTLPERSTANEEHSEAERIGDGKTIPTDQSTGHVPSDDLLEDGIVPLHLFEEDRPRCTSSPLQCSQSPEVVMERGTSPGVRWTLHSRNDSEYTFPIDLLETSKDASHGRSVPGAHLFHYLNGVYHLECILEQRLTLNLHRETI